MEELRDASIHHTALKFSEDIKQMKVYSNLFKTVQVMLLSITCQRDFDVSETGNFNQKHFIFTEVSLLARSLQR